MANPCRIPEEQRLVPGQHDLEEILKAATEVGRDVTPWLVQTPQLARAELVARVAPLYAYLTLENFPGPHPHNSGRRLATNLVYEHGTEKSARAAFGYRFGMTMAEWVCRAMMGLSPTQHIEDGGPENLKGFTDENEPRPDLWGVHATGPRYWLIEAKGGEVPLKALRRGAAQLREASKLMKGLEHRLVLCGASYKDGDHVFLTVDHEHIPGLPPISPPDLIAGGPAGAPGVGDGHLGDDDEALVGAARAQMLTYLALRFGDPASLRIVPMGAGRSRAHTGLVKPLEDDPSTVEARRWVRSHGPADYWETQQLLRAAGMDDFITGRVAGTDVRLGMSRRLFAACDTLYREDARVAERTPGLRAEDQREATLDDAEQQQRRHRQRLEFRERQYDARTETRRVVGEAFRRGADIDWSDLLGGGSPGTELGDGQLLEGATAETYVAIRVTDPVLSSASR